MEFVGAKEKIVAVADIGSASAAVAILSISKDKPARVLAGGRSSLPVEERTRDAAATQIAERLTDAGEKAMHSYSALYKKPHPVEEVYCVIHAPWIRSLPQSASANFETDKKITAPMIADLAKQALASQKDVDYANLLEASVVRVELNGYPTAKPEGKSAHSLILSILVSECDPQLRAAAVSGLQHLFPHLKPKLRSSVRALLSALHELPGGGNDRLVVDITGEETSLVVIREGTVGKLQPVKLGTRAILKQLSPQGMPEEMYTLIRMVGHDQCTSAACDAIRAAMLHVEPELVRTFGEAMSACTTPRRLPNSLLLLVHPDMQQWLGKFFGRIDFAQFTETTQPFDVQVLAAKDLAGALAPERQVVLDPSLALSAALVNTETGRT